MKINIYCHLTATAAAGGLLLTGCSSSDDEPGVTPAEQPREVTIVASIADDNVSRTGIDYNSPTGKTGMFWMPGDVVGAVSTVNGQYQQASMTNPGQSVQQRQVGFTGAVTGMVVGAYYPYTTNRTNGTITLPIAQNQIWSNATSVAANDIKAVKAGAAGWETDGTVIHAKFQSLGVMLLVRIVGSPAQGMTVYERLRSVKMTVPGSSMTGNFSLDFSAQDLSLAAAGSNYDNMTVEWDYVPLISAHPWGYCVIAPTDLTGKTVTFEITSIYDGHLASIPTHTTTLTLANGKNLEAGHVYTIDLDLTNIAAQ